MLQKRFILTKLLSLFPHSVKSYLAMLRRNILKQKIPSSRRSYKGKSRTVLVCMVKLQFSETRDWWMSPAAAGLCDSVCWRLNVQLQWEDKVCWPKSLKSSLCDVSSPMFTSSPKHCVREWAHCAILNHIIVLVMVMSIMKTVPGTLYWEGWRIQQCGEGHIEFFLFRFA